MTFQPVVPMGGLAGWNFLQRTLPTQRAAHAGTNQLERDLAHFRERIGRIDTAEALVADRTVLKVALGAFGLRDDLDNRFFVRKVLEGGERDPRSLANRLSDPRYAALAGAFGFGDPDGPRTTTADFASSIAARYRSRDFEAAVGRADPDMRLALSLERELSDLVTRTRSPKARWYSVLAHPPLRTVFETALGLPKTTGTLDIDRQLEVFRSKADAYFGTGEVADFLAPEALASLRNQFLVRAGSVESSGPLQGGVLTLLAGASGSGSILATLYGA